MMKNNFLHTLKKQEKLELVEPSEEICSSYTQKSTHCLTSAKLLLQNNLYENSISMSYYGMYNILLALLFKSGVKCENHSGAILLLKLLFDERDLFSLISKAKEERIDKQYYVTTEEDDVIGDAAEELFITAEDFVLKLKLVVSNLHIESVEEIRRNFEKLVN